MSNDKTSYYAVIPGNVRYDKRLRANEKLLYGEITALTNAKGYCWASNKYFADLYNVTTQAVSKWISHLKEYGYIDISLTYKSGTKEIENRIIKIVSTNDSEVSTNDLGVSTNESEGYQQKIKDNNTINNNTSNKKKVSKGESYDDLIESYTDDDDLRQSLKAFIQMRKLIKKPLTNYALKLILNKLDKMSTDSKTKTAIVNQSVEHSWQGVFPLKEEKTNKPTYCMNESKPTEMKPVDYTDFVHEGPDGIEVDIEGYKKACAEYNAWADSTMGVGFNGNE
ncbi:MAG: helix-turn-helix domain-containing protein [Bacillota bacterium]|jgi:hypothetical protein